MKSLKASLFFDGSNVFAETERLVLRKPIESEMLDYMDAFSTISPGLAQWYKNNEKALAFYWDSVNSEETLYCTVSSKEDGRFIGYCAIDKLDTDPIELGINLLNEYQNRGIGTESISALIDGFERIAGPTEFVAKIEAENARSQRMFRKLGFKPAGIDAFLIKEPELLRQFEDSRIDEIDDSIRALAEEFGVEPRKLLSHLLVFVRTREK